MAITQQTKPLEIARTVLPAEVLQEVVSHKQLTGRASTILDRWALNEPEHLVRLCQKSSAGLLNKLYEQQQVESRALESESALEMSKSGMSEWEILENLGIQTSLALGK